jgi:hypothetical protein
MNFYSTHSELNAVTVTINSVGKQRNYPMAVFTTRREKAKANRSAMKHGERHALR